MRVNRRAVISSAAWLTGITALGVSNFLWPYTSWGQFWGGWGFPIVFFVGVAFLIYYSLLARWWHSPMGRMIWWLDFSVCALLFGTILVNQFHVNFTVEDNQRVQVAGVLAAGIVIVSRIILLGHLHGWMPHWPWNLHRGSSSVLNPDKEETGQSDRKNRS